MKLNFQFKTEQKGLKKYKISVNAWPDPYRVTAVGGGKLSFTKRKMAAL
jgi:hypothetical protein